VWSVVRVPPAIRSRKVRNWSACDPWPHDDTGGRIRRG
jgi:hypothetical protein